MIMKLITDYPQFRKYYEEIYQLCRNTERVMEMFSKELQELDRNTVQYMVDEMQETIDAQKEDLSKQQDVITGQKDVICEQQKRLSRQEAELAEKDKEIEKLKACLYGKK